MARKGVFDSVFKTLPEGFDLERAGAGGTAVQARAKAPGGKGGSATRIAALVDLLGRPVRFELLTGRGHDLT